MSFSQAIVRLASVITVGMVARYAGMLIGWLDRRTGDPVMRERINAGSDQFFAAEEENWGKTEIDSIMRGDYDNV
jgi:hypothetical protein